jgi:hypothetical protein
VEGRKERILKTCNARNTVVHGFLWPVIFMKLKSHSLHFIKKWHIVQQFVLHINNTV